MNKKYVILILTTVFMLIPNIVRAEEVACEYTGVFENSFGKFPIDLVVSYENGNLNSSADVNFVSEAAEVEINLLFNYDKFMEYVNKNSSGTKCPYKLLAYMYNKNGRKVILDVYTSNNDISLIKQVEYRTSIWIPYLFACQNCSDGLGNMVIFDPEEYTTCEGILGTRLVNFINTIFNYVKVLVPVALIALGSFDIGRAVFAGNEDEMKKATKTFIRRLIIAVIIMFSPLLVNFIINVVNNATGTGYSGTCGIN